MNSQPLVEQSRTHDGISGNWPLTFTPIAVAIEPTRCILEISIEWNQRENKRRPYLSITIFRLHIQSGWLFG